jgi:hypothetical protein
LASSDIESPLASIDGPQREQPASLAQRHPVERGFFSSVLMLVAGFVLTSGILHFCIRDPLHLYAEVRSEKLAMLANWRGRASSAAFGSSHVDNGFDPRVFDAALRETDSATTSINLGISGGCQMEQAVIVKAFIDSLPAPAPDSQPRFVLLEITASANFTIDHLLHPRAINIYDFGVVRLATAFAGRDRVGLRRAIGRSAFAFAAGLLHYANVGMLSSEIFSAPLNSRLVVEETSSDRRGLTPNQTAPLGSREYIADEEILAIDRPPRPKDGEILEGHLAVLRNLATEARQKNVRFVYFVAPRLDNLDQYPTFPESIQGPLGPLLILNEGQPSVHPELYRADLWHDPTHLTERGAALFSKLLAEDLMSKLNQTDVAVGSALAVR